MSTKKSKKVAKRAKPKAKSQNTSAPSAFGVGKRGARYTPEQKSKVVDYVNEYNAKHGRGGQSQAAKQFGLSVLTVASWLRSPHIAGSQALAGKGGPVPAGLNAKFASLIEVSDQLRKVEGESARLRARYDAIRASIQALL